MIKLTRSIAVTTLDAQATVAVGRDRPEFLAVAQLAKDLGRPLDARTIAKELLGGLPEVVGTRVIERCVALGLLERAEEMGPAILSAAGRESLDAGEVLTPEEGVWRFFLVDDPLIPSMLIHAERIKTDKVKETRKDAKSGGVPTPARGSGGGLPEPCLDGLARTSMQSLHLFQIVARPSQGTVGPSGKLQAALTFNEQGTPTLLLTGALPTAEGEAPKAKVDVEVSVPEAVESMRFENAWQDLVEQGTGVDPRRLEASRNQFGRNVLPTQFEKLPDDGARRMFRQGVRVSQPSLPGLGEFESTVLRDLELVPDSDADATAWLHWLQWDAINAYATPSLLEVAAQQLRARFPQHHPRALLPQELLDRAHRNRTARSHFLLAPSDLGLWS